MQGSSARGNRKGKEDFSTRLRYIRPLAPILIHDFKDCREEVRRNPSLLEDLVLLTSGTMKTIYLK